MRGRFITLEGGEGAGKSTQARLLKERLTARGLEVVLTREPGGSPGAEEIRKLLVEGEPDRWTPVTETLLFLAARSDHVARVIGPALAKGAWVISDRFVDSTIVYQGIARGLGAARVAAMQEAAPPGVVPDLTVVLDIAPEQGLARAHARGISEARFEKFDQGFHAKLREAFLDIANAEPRRCVLVDAVHEPAEVAAEIWRAVEDRLKP